MKVHLFIFAAVFFTTPANGQQNVGIGTTTPNAKAILQLSSTTKGFLPPAMNNVQMNAITSPPPGLVIFNTQTQSQMVYAQNGWQFDTPSQNYIATFGWLPVSTGPRMIAWGKVDSLNFSNPTGPTSVQGSSENFTVTWDPLNRWYELKLNNMDYFIDSMILLITPVANGSWSQIVSTGYRTVASGIVAIIKFEDATFLDGGYNTLQARRRSHFQFVLYSMQKNTF